MSDRFRRRLCKKRPAVIRNPEISPVLTCRKRLLPLRCEDSRFFNCPENLVWVAQDEDELSAGRCRGLSDHQAKY